MTKHGYNVSPAYNFAKRLTIEASSEVLLLTYYCAVLSNTKYHAPGSARPRPWDWQHAPAPAPGLETEGGLGQQQQPGFLQSGDLLSTRA